MKKSLILVPHQDDEINLVGNIVDKIKNEYELYVVYSSLDVRSEYGKIRKQEAYASCVVWGIDAEHIIFLEYPDISNKEGKHYFTDGDHEIVDRLQEMIVTLKPDIIFATDFDYHADHRMLSLAFEEAMGKVLKACADYKPTVLKGFCYDTAYYGLEDYKASKPGKNEVVNRDILSNCSLEWKDRWSILGSEEPGFIWNRKAYKALSKHKSQYAVLHAKSIINADNVFWNKRTDNLMLNAHIESISGDVSKLNDFMVIDTDDIITIDPRNIDYSKVVWDSGSKNAEIKIYWDNDINIDRLIFHGNPNWTEDKQIEICILDAVGRKIADFSGMKSYGRNTEVCFDEICTHSLIVKFLSETIDIELSEIEAFCGDGRKCMLVDNDAIVPGKDNSIIDLIDNLGYKWIVFKTKVGRKILKLVRR